MSNSLLFFLILGVKAVGPPGQGVGFIGLLRRASGQGVSVGFFLLGTTTVIREDFADIENLVSICLFSLISVSDFARVLRSLTVGALDTF